MLIKEIPYHSSLYEASKLFRQEILRTPLGLELSAKDIEGEDQQIHICALDNEECIKGTVVLKPVSADTIKLRQMAVASNQQGKGLGKNIVLFAENLAKAKRFATIEMHARVFAQVFYEKLGYQTTGDVFTEVTVPTIKMYKNIP